MHTKLIFPIVVIVLVVVWQTKVGRYETHEASAIGALSAINLAQASYAATAGHGGYAASLQVLAMPCPGSTRSLLTPDLTPGRRRERMDYRIVLHDDVGHTGPLDCNGVPTRTEYYASAEPIDVGRKGSTRAFATDQTSTIWFDTRGVAPRPPFAETATVKPVQ